MKGQKKKKRGLCLLSWLLAAFLLCGCRESPVLEEVVYVADADEVDTDEQQLDPEDEGEEDERFENEQKDEAETERDTDDLLAAADDGADGDSDSRNVRYDENGSDQYQASDKPGNKKKGSGSGSGDEETDDGDLPEEYTGEESAGTSTDGDSGEGTNPTNTADSDSGGHKKVTDDRGEEVEIPEDVETVTAVGAAASMVEMLGGTGRLLGADEEFLNNSLSKKAFSDLGSVKSWWSGSGKTAISESAFAELLLAKPEVCFEISGDNTFTDSQIERLTKAGIGYFVLPQLSDADSIKSAVTMMAQILTENSITGASAKTIAASYGSWVDETVSDISSLSENSVLASIYIADWEDVEYTLTGADGLPSEAGITNGRGKGAAVAWSAKKNAAVSAFMKVAGVTNESARSSLYAQTEGIYVMPMFSQFSPVFSNSSRAFYDKGVGEGYDLFLCTEVSAGNYKMLGDSTYYPAVIAADEEVKRQLESSWFWEYHGVVKKNGISWNSGYIDAFGTLLYGSICGSYDIYVNPSGIGDWAEGCVESPLEAYWISYKFTGKVNKSTLYSKVSSFYETFFRCSLTADEVGEILGE